ncbi:MAG TPA: cupin domain-containing protein [Solirubrobacteraceae bacterium]
MKAARIETTPEGKVPADDGWFILNLSEIGWETVAGGGTWCLFESPAAPSGRLGIGVHVLLPGEKPGFYHAENEQEGFLVLSGECVAVVEGQERRMRTWDYLHCPADTAHITIGAGETPCAILMVGTRSPNHRIRYLVDATAAAHGASVSRPTTSPEEAYADRPPFSATAAPPPFG